MTKDEELLQRSVKTFERLGDLRVWDGEIEADGLTTYFDYDPICFDLNRFAHDDCPIVGFHHERILCNDDLSESETIFSSFRQLVYETLDVAD